MGVQFKVLQPTEPPLMLVVRWLVRVRSGNAMSAEPVVRGAGGQAGSRGLDVPRLPLAATTTYQGSQPARTEPPNR